MTPRRDVSMSPDEIDDLLELPVTGVLSTLGRDGAPHMAGMWFAHSRDRLLMWTYGKSQKAVNARRDPRAAFLVEEGMAYNELRGVLLQGELEVITDVGEIDVIGRLLYDRYTLPTTGIPVEEGPHLEIARQAAKRVGLALPLADVSSWDHSKLG